MGPGAPDIGGIMLLGLTMMAFVAVMTGIAWRAIICTMRIYPLRWYYAHPIGIVGGFVSAVIYCLAILMVWRFLPREFTRLHFPMGLIGVYFLVFAITIAGAFMSRLMNKPDQQVSAA